MSTDDDRRRIIINSVTPVATLDEVARLDALKTKLLLSWSDRRFIASLVRRALKGA